MIIGDVLRKWRRQSDIGILEAAKRIGISSATLSRIERGEQMEGRILAKVLVWLLSEKAA